MRNVRLALLRAHHDPAYPQISDPACIAMLMRNDDRTAVLQYWEAVTRRQLTFDGTELMPWVTIPVTDPLLSREEQIRLAFDATRLATGSDLAQFDGVVVLVHPGVVQTPNPQAGQAGQNPTIPVTMADAGAWPAPNGKPACALHWLSRSHTFFCHEVGHVAGFRHTWGVLNTDADWDQMAPWSMGREYGDPYDIMAAEGFGQNRNPGWPLRSSQPTFALADPTGWAVQPDPTLPWLPRRTGASTAGPALSQAYLHWAYPDAFPGSTVATSALPQLNAPPQRVRLWAADSGGYPRLLLLRPQPELPGAQGRVYLEYRRPVGWDRGLDVVGTDTARQAVVAHTISSTAGGLRPWYRGSVPVPVGVDSDLVVGDSPAAFRVVEAQDDWVDVEVDVAYDRRVDLSVRRLDDVLLEEVVGAQWTPCGDRLRVVRRVLGTTMWFRATSVGFGGRGEFDEPVPALTWTVGGEAVTSAGGSVAVASGVETYDVACAVDPVTQELELRSYGGQRYDVDVAATVTEGGASLRAVDRFAPLGWYVGVSPDDGWLVRRCLQRWAKSKRLFRWDILRERELLGVDEVGNPVLDRTGLRAAVREVLDDGLGRADEQAVEAVADLLELQLAMSLAGPLR